MNHPFSAKITLPKIREPILVLPLVLLGCIHFGLFGTAMLPSSLWIDEIISIRDYSGNGPLAALTTYHEPNNHIFYNFLQSLMPWRGSYEPLAARFLSLAFTSAGAVAGAQLLFRRHLWFEGSLFVLVIGYSSSLLAVLLNARGYGLQFFLTILLLWMAASYSERESRRDLVGMSLTTALAVWVAPSILLFLVPFYGMYATLLAPRREVVYAIFATCALILVMHLPVLREFLIAFMDYDDAHGAFFGSWQSFLLVFQVISGDFHPYGIIGLAFLSLAYGTLLKTRALRWKASVLQTLCLLSLVAFFFALILARLSANVPPRVFAGFAPALLLPLMVLPIDFLRRLMGPASLKSCIGLFVVVVMLVYPGREKLQNVSYLPIENWKGTAAFIHDAFPEGTAVWSFFRPELLQLYLNDSYPLTREFDQSSFERGEMIVVDSDFWAGDRYTDRVDSDAFGIVRIPQFRNAYQAVIFQPRSGKAIIQQKQLPLNGNPPAGIGLDVSVAGAAAFRGLLIESAGGFNLVGVIHPGEPESIVPYKLQYFDNWTFISFESAVTETVLFMEPVDDTRGVDIRKVHVVSTSY